MARKATHDWSYLLAVFFERQEQDSSYKKKEFAEDEGLSIGSLSRALTQYRKGEIELADLSLSDRKNDHKGDHNSDRQSQVVNSQKAVKLKSKQDVKVKSKGESGGCTRNSDRSQSEVPAKRKRGGQLGNRNAVTHGLYATALSEEQQQQYEQALGAAGGVEHELALARIKLAEAFRKKAEQEALETYIEEQKRVAAETGKDVQLERDADGNVIPTDALPARFNHAAMQPDAFEDNTGVLGMTIKMKRIDWDAVIDRWMGRIANLESLRQKLLQGHVLSHSERLAIQSTTFNQLAEGVIDAVTAGNLLSANAIEIPANLLAQIRVELGTDEDEGELPKGGVTPQIVEEREKALQIGNAQAADEFMAERMAALEELNAAEVNDG